MCYGEESVWRRVKEMEAGGEDVKEERKENNKEKGEKKTKCEGKEKREA